MVLIFRRLLSRWFFWLVGFELVKRGGDSSAMYLCSCLGMFWLHFCDNMVKMQQFYSSRDMSSNTATISCVSQIYRLTVFKSEIARTVWRVFLSTRTLSECSSIQRGNQLIVTFGLSPANSRVTHQTSSVQELQANWRSTAALLTLTHFMTSTCWSLTPMPERNFMVWWNRSESNKRINKVFRMKIRCSDNQTTTSRCGLIDWLID